LISTKSRKEQFETWKKRLKVAKQLHKEKVIEWANTVLKEYSGDAKKDADTNERFTQIAQIIIAVEETVAPQLMYQNPTVSAVSKNPAWERREGLVSAVINQEYNDIKPTGHSIELENELVILEARLLGYGATKSSWEVEGDILEEEPDQDMIEKLRDKVTGRPPEMIETPVIEKEIGHVTEHVSALEILLDYSASHITKQKFTIHMMDVPKEKLLKARYERDKVNELKPSSCLFPEQGNKSRSELERLMEDPDFKAFRIYEIEDLENRVIHTMVDGYDDFIEFDAPHSLPEGTHITFLWFIEVPKQVYPEPPLKYYRKRAHEFSYIFSKVSESIDKFMPKIGIDVNRLSKASQDRLKTGNLGAIVQFDGTPAGGWDVIQPQVNPDLFKYMAMTKELLNLESGTSDVELLSPDQNQTATEVNKVSNSSRNRRFKPQKRVKGFIINQAHTIWQILSQNSTEERFAKVLGENDALEWWEDPETGRNTWTKEDIAGDYAFQIDVESLSPLDKRARDKQNFDNMQTVLNPQLEQNLLKEGKQLLTSGIFEKFAKDTMGIKDRSKIIKDLQFIEPGDEQSLWMQGQFPPISEREIKDPQFLMKHFNAHMQFMNSPAFSSLPPQIQHGVMNHIESYLPLVQKIQAQQGNGGAKAPSSQKNKGEEKPSVPVPAETGNGFNAN
jgi:hypothetical protein